MLIFWILAWAWKLLIYVLIPAAIYFTLREKSYETPIAIILALLAAFVFPFSILLFFLPKRHNGWF
jgi:hypothetical protein